MAVNHCHKIQPDRASMSLESKMIVCCWRALDIPRDGAASTEKLDKAILSLCFAINQKSVNFIFSLFQATADFKKSSRN